MRFLLVYSNVDEKFLAAYNMSKPEWIFTLLLYYALL